MKITPCLPPLLMVASLSVACSQLLDDEAVANDTDACVRDCGGSEEEDASTTDDGAGEDGASGDQATCTGAKDGEPCGAQDVCLDGSCVACTDGADCTLPVDCRVGQLTCALGAAKCVEVGNASDGTMCNDGNGCTQTDRCEGGYCVGSDPIACTASDNCHEPGTCNPASGECSNPSRADGESCGEAKACMAGSCRCEVGTSDCAGTCVDLTRDDSNCGACGHSCMFGSCENSSCGSWTIAADVHGDRFGFATDGTSVVWFDTVKKDLLQVDVGGGTPIELAVDLPGRSHHVELEAGVVTVSFIDATESGGGEQTEVWRAIAGSEHSGMVLDVVGDDADPVTELFGTTLIPSAGRAFPMLSRFVSGSSIHDCIIGGGGSCSKLMSVAPSPTGSDILADQEYLFWTDGNSVKRFSFADEETVDAATSVGLPFPLALSATHLFWANRDTAFVVNRTSRTNPTPTAPDPVLSATVGSLYDLAADEHRVYFGGKAGSTKIGYVPVDGGAATALLEGETGAVFWLEVDGGALYFWDSGDATIRGIVPPPL